MGRSNAAVSFPMCWYTHGSKGGVYRRNTLMGYGKHVEHLTPREVVRCFSLVDRPNRLVCIPVHTSLKVMEMSSTECSHEHVDAQGIRGSTTG